ncbi:MAG: CPBP family intramembrane glutamic endopeptidase [Janthinobacterium lividum]
MEYELRPFWSRFFTLDEKFGLFLILIVCVPRFLLVLQANVVGNYSAIGMIMIASATAPFLFLTRYGQEKIGIIKPKRYDQLMIGFFIGLLFSFLLFYIGKIFFGNTYQNWYNYIGRSYQISPRLNGHDKAILFAVMASTGMVFSPVGEELFFRGIVHASFTKYLGDKKSSLIDSSAFALTHISHFGLVYITGVWKLLFLPTLIWVAAMFLVSMIFFRIKKQSGSIWGAVICHAGFNLGMIYCIFYLL